MPGSGHGCARMRLNTPCHGFRRAWSALRFDEGHEVNIKRVHRLWRSEGLQVRAHHPRKRAGISSIPPVEADAPRVVWRWISSSTPRSTAKR
ncbi:IS3 family transposase [Nocardia sp. NPDC049190]|uniref:IS3 family transposase n=1 Tax=Nocardia sp. NPDC049190 TaxID=3155650 RepID=UPI00340D24C0